jgi:hypothetical protein
MKSKQVLTHGTLFPTIVAPVLFCGQRQPVRSRLYAESHGLACAFASAVAVASMWVPGTFDRSGLSMFISFGMETTGPVGCTAGSLGCTHNIFTFVHKLAATGCFALVTTFQLFVFHLGTACRWAGAKGEGAMCHANCVCCLLWCSYYACTSNAVDKTV